MAFCIDCKHFLTKHKPKCLEEGCSCKKFIPSPNSMAGIYEMHQEFAKLEGQ